MKLWLVRWFDYDGVPIGEATVLASSQKQAFDAVGLHPNEYAYMYAEMIKDHTDA